MGNPGIPINLQDKNIKYFTGFFNGKRKAEQHPESIFKLLSSCTMHTKAVCFPLLLERVQKKKMEAQGYVESQALKERGSGFLFSFISV